MTAINRIKDFLLPSKEVSIAPLVIFRIIFGALMLFGISRFLFKGWVYDLYIAPTFHFKYLGFEWIEVLDGNWMYLPFILMIISALGIIFGAFYRISALVFFLCFTYVELLDKSYYLNHYYFVSLVSFLMILVPANRLFSLDVKFNRVQQRTHTPQWTIRIIQFQLACVYFFAGVAKINSDWLFNAQPLKIWLQSHRDLPFFGSFLATDWVAYFFSWFGCIYDLFIPLFLLIPSTRKFAYFFVVSFHIITWYLFPIGVFPWVMIFSTLIFFRPIWHEKRLYQLASLFKKDAIQFETSTLGATKTKGIKLFLVLFISAQLLLPFRYLLYPGHLFWNEEGFRFSWRVMLMHKEGNAVFYVKDKKTGGTIEIINRDYLTQTQEDQMATQPDMLLQYAQMLDKEFSDTILQFGNTSYHLTDPSIHAEVHVSLNGRPSQLFVDQKHALNTLPYNLYHRNWIEPFKP